ncbi:MAG: ATP-binding protein [Actinomycetota bacterium]|nr:ATP-binding protein [Actinomycetota bacterium]
MERNREGTGITQHTGTHGGLAPGTDAEAAASAARPPDPATDLRGAALRLFALSVDPMATADFDGYIRHANPAWEQVLGWTMVELRSRPYVDFVHPDDRERTLQQAAALAQDDVETRDFEVRFRATDGSYRSLSVSAQASAAEGLIYAVAKDITERREAEQSLARATEQLRRRAAELERSNADLEQFAYVASHDLSEPLRMVSGFVQLLAKRYEGRLDAEADEFIAYAVEGVTRMQELIDDLLTFSRIGRDGRESVEVDLARVARRALEALSTHVAEAGATVAVDELPTVRGHQRELSQLFQNLLSNGLKFRGTEPPRIKLSARLDVDATQSKGPRWEFSVADNGIGIEPRHAERIFKMFQRLHGRDVYPGTGIGLPICKKVVEHHEGRIWVEPNPDGGTVFKFTLSAAEATG